MIKRRARYSTKLLSWVALACLASLAAIGVSIQSFRQAVRARESAEMTHASDLVLCHQLAQLTERKLAKSRSYIITRDESFVQEMEDARSEFLAVAGELKGRMKSAEGSLLRDRVIRLESQHHELLREITSRRRAGTSVRELSPLLIDRLKPVRDELDEGIRRLIELKEARLNEAQAGAAASVRFAQRVSLGAGAASILGFAVVLLLVRGLSRAQMNLEHALRRSNFELDALVEERTKELSATNRELESFSYSIAHDLRTPLRAITNYSDLALEQLGEGSDGRLKDRVRQIRSAGLRMSRTIDALLSLSRLTRRPLNMREFDLSAVASDVNATLAQANLGRAVSVDIEPRLTETGDPDLLRVVLQNLFDNAWKFTAKRSDRRVSFCRVAIEGRSAYAVRDNGAGFDPAFARKLFTPFERLHAVEEFPGSGIGLAAVERIIHRHGGSVWAEGRPGEGAAFYFTLHHRMPGKERAARSMIRDA